MTNAIWGKYEELRPSQIEAIRDHAPIAYVCWGALEWHSYHNPIGLDGLKAHGIMCELASRVGGIVLPPFYLGTDTIKPFKGFPHTIDFPREIVKSVAAQVLRQLVDEKFKAIVFLTGHYGGDHVKALEETVEEFEKEFTEAPLWFFPDWIPLQGRFEPNHAAWGETSFQMYFNKDLVDLSALPKDREGTLDEDGIWGEDPRKSSVEDGRKMVEALMEVAVPKVREMLRQVS